MTRRIVCSLLLAVATIAIGTPRAHGGWHEFVHRSMLDWHRNNAWPQPFVKQDSISVCSPFVIMSQNGMKSEFTLGDHHFNPESHALTEAGQRKVYEILKRQPEGFDRVFVMRGRDEDSSSIRLDAVQQQVAAIIPNGSLPLVEFTDYSPRGVPANYVDVVDRKVMASVPDPRLPAFEATTN